MRRFAAALLAVVALGVLAGCGRDTPYQQESYVFGTRVEVLIFGAPKREAAEAAAAVLREFDRLHTTLHAWQPSALTRVNEAIGRGETAAVDAELAAVLADAKRIAAASDGLFDPALGELIGLWGFQSDEFSARLPEPQALERLRQAKPSMADVSIGDGRVASRNPAVRFDLGGYAKGYALDRAADLLRARNVKNALINIGGNVLALGDKGGRPWRVGIQHPRAPAPLATLELRDGEAIGTSGDYQRYFELDGRRYCHILDPRSGAPAEGTQAVTVLVTPRSGAGTLSDAASKPVFVAGDEGWRTAARRLDIDHVLRVDAGGRIAVTRALLGRLSFAEGVAPAEVVD